ncbi:PIN/TRAM domain-containing protein [Planctomicrobium sp. SH668]|uniref:PIN/TRAM domain-containing protein n=1 Tax=Planctomicrobium sp. SH668 TaxID=3448126 RepID=UPI003F5C1EA4
MLLTILRATYILICVGALATFCFTETDALPQPIRDNNAVAFFLLTLTALSVLLVDVLVPVKRVDIVSSIYFGLLVGVMLAYMCRLAVSPFFSTRELFGDDGWRYLMVFTLMTVLIMPYLCITFLLQTKDQFRLVIPYVEFSRELKGGRPLILDSSALIDGRIADLVATNIVDSEFVVPQFILQEVQDIADSHDKLRRGRGRRGLDVLKRLQQDPKVDIKVQETDANSDKTVDQRLVEISRELNGRLVTNDVNLNKLASVQGVDVVNLNEVANSLKPRFIPGEQVRIRIIKEGEGQSQGIGYLDDGTMVVVENGTREMGNEVDTIVTSVLQNNAGRMIFSRLVDGQV